MNGLNFIIERKLLSFQDTYIIKNLEGVQLGKVEKKFLSSDFVFRDNNGNELLHIKGELITFGPSYKILDSEGRFLVKINKKFRLFGASFSIEDESKKKIFEIRGDLLNYNYIFVNSDGVLVARVHKEPIYLAESYCLDIIEGIDPRVALGCSIAIDLMRKK